MSPKEFGPATVAILAALLLATGCKQAPPRQLSTTCSEFAMLPNGRDPMAPDRMAPAVKESFDSRIQDRFAAGDPLQILELSGGGQNGAFGAGFLAGWAEQGTRPQFDIVTGVSVGALFATWAFLGTPEDDETLRRLWLSIDRDHISKSRSMLSILMGADSLETTGPLRKVIDGLVTQAVLDRVAAEYDKGRHLYVATVNIDYKQIWVWDLARLAKHGGDGALDRYRTILHAAPSAPVVFPPVEIDGSLFVDSGTRSNLLLAGLTTRVSERIEELKKESEHHAGTANHADIYVILDGQIGLKPHAVRRSLKGLAAESLAMMMDSATEASIFQAFVVAKLQGYDFNFVQIPAEYNLKSSLDFDVKEMKELYEAGRELGRQSDPWSHLPPQSEENSKWLLEALNVALTR